MIDINGAHNMLLVRDETGPPDPQVSNNMYFCEIILLQIFGFQKNSLLAVFNLDQSRPTFGFLMFSGGSKEVFLSFQGL